MCEDQSNYMDLDEIDASKTSRAISSFRAEFNLNMQYSPHNETGALKRIDLDQMVFYTAIHLMLGRLEAAKCALFWTQIFYYPT